MRDRLSDRDNRILDTLRKLDFMTTNQIQRLFILDSASPDTAARTSRRAMAKLRDYGLVQNLGRRIGGIRAGSSATIWHLSEAGYRYLDLDSENKVRKRQLEPSITYLNHILSVAECYTQLHEICRDTTTLSHISVEPECWRPYRGRGKVIQLKPDLFAITKTDGYEDRWFIEMDLDTESANVISTKCDRYRDYYKANIEQRNSGVFPVVLWIVPTIKRKEKLQEVIKASQKTALKMFLIITPNELKTLITQGFESYGLY